MFYERATKASGKPPPPYPCEFFCFGSHLYGGVNRPEVDGLEDVAVELGSLVRLEGQSHLDVRVREPLVFYFYNDDDSDGKMKTTNQK